MTESLTPINVSTDAWVDLVDRVNEIISAFANNVASTGGTVNGNITVNGNFYASSVYSGGTLVVKQDRTVTAGTGLTGGGNLSNNITIALDSNTVALLDKANTALQTSDFSGKIGLQNNVSVSQINASGTANSTTYLRGDGSWSEPDGGGGTVTSVNGETPDEFGDISLLANSIPFSPSGNLSSIEVESAITELESEKLAVAALPSANGLVVIVGGSLVSRQVISANASHLSVTNSDGASGNVTIAFSANTINALSLATTSIQPNGAQTLNQKTLQNPTIDGVIKEDVFSITDNSSVIIDPQNGTIQYWTLGANRSPSIANTNWKGGMSITLHINDGSAYTVDWGSVGVTLNWVNGSAPTLATTGFNVIEMWRITDNSPIRAAYVGSVA